MRRVPWGRARPALLVCLAGLGLSACGATLSSMPLIGEPKNDHQRPAASAFPNVFVETAEPPEQAMTAAQRDALTVDLATTRDTVAARRRQAIAEGEAAHAPRQARPNKTKKQATSDGKCEKEPCPR
jgi:hypothetical protein